jgi:hypothetical protein
LASFVCTTLAPPFSTQPAGSKPADDMPGAYAYQLKSWLPMNGCDS